MFKMDNEIPASEPHTTEGTIRSPRVIYLPSLPHPHPNHLSNGVPGTPSILRTDNIKGMPGRSHLHTESQGDIGFLLFHCSHKTCKVQWTLKQTKN